VSFLITAALAVALLIAVPIAAHLLRRGRADERQFPPAALVPTAPPVARQRSRLEDRALLAVRALMIAALAVLGATPLVRCSRLSLARNAGASVALAIVIDDSLSMRARMPGAGSRWDRARAAASDLLGSAREGDAVAVVLAGAPARLGLAATTDLAAARRALRELSVTDRATDLAGAVQIARSALQQLPHVDKRVVLLSDLAGDPIPPGQPPAWAPIAELSAPIENCGIASAERSGRNVSVTVGCTSGGIARGRELLVTSGESIPPSDAAAGARARAAGEVIARGRLAVRSGIQTVSIDLDADLVVLDVKLGGSDDCEHDDRAPVAPRSGGLVVAAVSDPSSAAVTTGGPTVLEQALEALAADAVVRPQPLLPDEPKELAAVAALILDDPAGIPPEARLAITDWLERGGVALALLGPRVDAAKLGTTLEPFVRGEVSFGPTDAKGVDPKSAPWLGETAASLTELGASGRVELDTAAPADSRVVARWDDGRAFMMETTIGRGLAVSASLPASVETSDFALRPGFLALLDHVLAQAARRSGPPRSPAGVAWLFAGSSEVEIQGPDGPLPIREQRSASNGQPAAQKLAVPEVRGRYRVRTGSTETLRVVTLDADELVRKPREAAQAGVVEGSDDGGARVDASSELALVLLILITIELAVRMLGRTRRRRIRRTDAGPDDLRRAA
jgi:hypothetical protein